MSTSSLVSVVLPFLDAEAFLDEAVRSVIAQTHEHWELLLVDDGSTDGSPEIAARWSGQDPRIRVLEHEGHENRGISASRNLGLKHASGEFVALLDADDVFLPGKLEHQLAEFERRPEAGMIYGQSLYWFSWTGDPADRARDWVQSHGVPAGELLFPPETLVRYLDGTAAIPCPCSVLARREVVTAVGGFEDEFRGMYEDQVFFSKVAFSYPVLPGAGCLDRYRQHADSICSVTDRIGTRLVARRKYLDWMREFLHGARANDPRLWEALREEAWLARERGLVPDRWRARARWLDRWLLRAESTLLPDTLRRGLWSRRMPGWNGTEAP